MCGDNDVRGGAGDEWLLRVLATEPLRNALKDPFCVVDLVCIAPFWVRILLYRTSFQPDSYLIRHARPLTVRSLEAIASGAATVF